MLPVIHHWYRVIILISVVTIRPDIRVPGKKNISLHFLFQRRKESWANISTLFHLGINLFILSDLISLFAHSNFGHRPLCHIYYYYLLLLYRPLRIHQHSFLYLYSLDIEFPFIVERYSIRHPLLRAEAMLTNRSDFAKRKTTPCKIDYNGNRDRTFLNDVIVVPVFFNSRKFTYVAKKLGNRPRVNKAPINEEKVIPASRGITRGWNLS